MGRGMEACPGLPSLVDESLCLQKATVRVSAPVCVPGTTPEGQAPVAFALLSRWSSHSLAQRTGPCIQCSDELKSAPLDGWLSKSLFG